MSAGKAPIELSEITWDPADSGVSPHLTQPLAFLTAGLDPPPLTPRETNRKGLMAGLKTNPAGWDRRGIFGSQPITANALK